MLGNRRPADRKPIGELTDPARTLGNPLEHRESGRVGKRGQSGTQGHAHSVSINLPNVKAAQPTFFQRCSLQMIPRIKQPFTTSVESPIIRIVADARMLRFGSNARPR